MARRVPWRGRRRRRRGAGRAPDAVASVVADPSRRTPRARRDRPLRRLRRAAGGGRGPVASPGQGTERTCEPRIALSVASSDRRPVVVTGGDDVVVDGEQRHSGPSSGRAARHWCSMATCATGMPGARAVVDRGRHRGGLLGRPVEPGHRVPHDREHAVVDRLGEALRRPSSTRAPGRRPPGAPAPPRGRRRGARGGRAARARRTRSGRPRPRRSPRPPAPRRTPAGRRPRPARARTRRPRTPRRPAARSAGPADQPSPTKR